MIPAGEKPGMQGFGLVPPALRTLTRQSLALRLPVIIIAV